MKRAWFGFASGAKEWFVAAMVLSPAFSRFLVPVFILVWATGFIAARLAAPHADPLTFLMARYLFAIVVLATIARASGAVWPRTRTDWRDTMIAGALMHGGYLGGVWWAVKHGLPAGITALLAGLQPLLTACLSHALLREPVSLRRWAGIGIGFAGAVLVVWPKLGTLDGFAGWPLTICIGAVLSITFGTIWQKRTGSETDLRTGAAVQYIGAACVTLPLALLTESGRFDPVPETFIALFWSVFVLSIGGVGLWLYLIRRGAVAHVTSLLYIVPPVSALMAFVLFGETLTEVQMAGMAVAACGVALAAQD